MTRSTRIMMACPPSAARKQRFSDRRRKEIVEKKVQLRDPSDAAARSAVHRNDSFRRNLNITAGPDEARVDRARRPVRTAVERRRKREFDNGNEAIERLAPSGALHVRVQIRNAVLDREAPLQHVRMTLDVDVAFIVDRRGAGARWNGDAELSGDREGTQIFHLVPEVAATLAEKEQRRKRRKRFCADALRSASAESPIDAGRHNRLVLVALIELVFGAQREIVESALRIAAVRPQFF